MITSNLILDWLWAMVVALMPVIVAIVVMLILAGIVYVRLGDRKLLMVLIYIVAGLCVWGIIKFFF